MIPQKVLFAAVIRLAALGCATYMFGFVGFICAFLAIITANLVEVYLNRDTLRARSEDFTQRVIDRPALGTTCQAGFHAYMGGQFCANCGERYQPIY